MNLRSIILACSAVTMLVAADPSPALPADAAYVQVRDGHLSLEGQRVRYWGFIGNPWWDSYYNLLVKAKPDGEARQQAVAKVRADIDLAVQRIHDLGFNLVRSWHDIDKEYAKGDGSQADLTAYYFDRLDRKGIKIWQAKVGAVSTFTADDVSVIDDPATAPAWTAAVTEWMAATGNKPVHVWNVARIWDPRIEAIGLRQMHTNAQFRNHYKGGVKVADDPQMVVWELTNEEWWFSNMFGGGQWASMPAFFRNQLLSKWCDFLTTKYGSEEKLTAAWGFVLPGESLAQKSIMLLPLGTPLSGELAANDVNQEALAKLRGVSKKYGIEDFTRKRGEDVLEFLTKLLITHKQRSADRLKTWGKSCRLSPTIWDTGNCYQIQSGYMFQFSDAAVLDTYVKGMGHDPTTKRWPFFSGLDASPRLCWNVPWVEQGRQKGKPTFIYETQIDCRTKYRAEFPFQIAALGAIQDWDIVNWHTYDSGVDSSAADPFGHRLHVWHDYLGYGQDEVQLSAMKASAETFKHSLLPPAPAPTTFVFGRKSLYDPQSMNYGKSYGDQGRSFTPTAYRYGVQVVIDPSREDDEIIGPSLHEDIRAPNPTRPNDSIEYDWGQGHLKFDAPGVIGYVGFFGQRTGPVTFRSGASFTKVTVSNPPGIAYPVTPDENYVAIMVASQDSQPLATTKRAVVSAVSTSFNTGYKLDLTKSAKGNRRNGPENVPPRIWKGAWPEDPGTGPAIVARVGVTITAPEIAGMAYTLRDWQMRDIGQGTVTDGVLTIPSDKPIFVIELRR